MKKMIAMMLALLLTVTVCLTGCGCDHDWQEATCLAPRTCALCDETEGEFGAHRWEEATCLTPKTCETCGLTEGKALGHSWQEATCQTPETCPVCGMVGAEALGHTMGQANYQQPATCETCGYVEGDVLTPDFEVYGLRDIDAEMGVEYDYVTSCYGNNSDKKTVGKLVLSDYRVFAGDETHEPLEGYVWHTMHVQIVFGDVNAWNYGFNVRPCWDDYYTLDVWGDGGGDSFCANYNGIGYTECLFQGDKATISDWDRATKTCVYNWTCAWRVPEGYDGFLLGFYDSSITYEPGQRICEFMDENVLFFRFPGGYVNEEAA